MGRRHHERRRRTRGECRPPAGGHVALAGGADRRTRHRHGGPADHRNRAHPLRYPPGRQPSGARAHARRAHTVNRSLAAGMSPPQVARKLRVSRKSAYVLHKAWRTAKTRRCCRKTRVGSTAG
ncbi:helix-turn-helix domain-containing protein [Nonomuraea sp. 10N515B]|uniref:helix-turn-helix domain-containing protein n=1 Tax=Nonomuraea sp. 10N515B TaxID=3457422 RepID=UPI003FCEE61E